MGLFVGFWNGVQDFEQKISESNTGEDASGVPPLRLFFKLDATLSN
jgi:hypothetical protein